MNVLAILKDFTFQCKLDRPMSWQWQSIRRSFQKQAA